MQLTYKNHNNIVKRSLYACDTAQDLGKAKKKTYQIINMLQQVKLRKITR